MIFQPDFLNVPENGYLFPAISASNIQSHELTEVVPHYSYNHNPRNHFQPLTMIVHEYHVFMKKVYDVN